MTVELNARIQQDLGLPVADRGLVLSGVAGSTGIPVTQAQSMYDQGKAKADDGALAAPYVSGLILSMTTIAESQNLNIDRERIVELYAELSGQSVDDVRSMADTGAG